MRTYKTRSLLFVLIGCTIFFSCKKNNGGSSIYNGSKITFQKRWNISSKNLARPALNNDDPNNNYAHRPANDTSFTAIEFIDSSYIISWADGTTYAGQYNTTNDTTLTLDSLGTIVIQSLTANTFDFVLQPNDSSSSILFFSNAAAPVSSFSNTADSAFITNTWQMDSIILPAGGKTIASSAYEQYINFSAYGTFLSKIVTNNGTNTYYDIEAWLWTDDTHQSFCYNTGNSLNLINCNGTGSVTASIIYSQQYTAWQLKESESNGVLNEYFHKK